MITGIVSDSHGRARKLRRAVEILVGRGAEAIVYCGDFGTIACFDPLAEAPVQTYAVPGNMDRHILADLASAAARAGVVFRPQTVEVPLGDERLLAALHGHNEQILADAVRGGRFAYVCHGHTHCVSDRRIGHVRVICPGALSAPKGRRELTCALLDTAADTVDLLVVD